MKPDIKIDPVQRGNVFENFIDEFLFSKMKKPIDRIISAIAHFRNVAILDASGSVSPGLLKYIVQKGTEANSLTTDVIYLDMDKINSIEEFRDLLVNSICFSLRPNLSRKIEILPKEIQDQYKNAFRYIHDVYADESFCFNIKWEEFGNLNMIIRLLHVIGIFCVLNDFLPIIYIRNIDAIKLLDQRDDMISLFRDELLIKRYFSVICITTSMSLYNDLTFRERTPGCAKISFPPITKFSTRDFLKKYIPNSYGEVSPKNLKRFCELTSGNLFFAKELADLTFQHAGSCTPVIIDKVFGDLLNLREDDFQLRTSQLSHDCFKYKIGISFKYAV